MRKVEILPTLDREGGYGTVSDWYCAFEFAEVMFR